MYRFLANRVASRGFVSTFLETLLSVKGTSLSRLRTRVQILPSYRHYIFYEWFYKVWISMLLFTRFVRRTKMALHAVICLKLHADEWDSCDFFVVSYFDRLVAWDLAGAWTLYIYTSLQSLVGLTLNDLSELKNLVFEESPSAQECCCWFNMFPGVSLNKTIEIHLHRYKLQYHKISANLNHGKWQNKQNNLLLLKPALNKIKNLQEQYIPEK